MKTKEIPINTDQDVELTIIPEYQATPFVIAGDYGAIEPLYEQAKLYDVAEKQAHPSKPVHRTAKAAETIVAMSTSVRERVIGRLATDIKTIAYDRTHGTQFYDALQQKRADERNLKFAVGLGLISLTDVSCRKHEHAVAKMRGL